MHRKYSIINFFKLDNTDAIMYKKKKIVVYYIFKGIILNSR